MLEVGDFVELRGRRWLVETVDAGDSDLRVIGLSCISDDAQGESLEILWDAEISWQNLDESGWRQIVRGASDTSEILAAHVRAVRWDAATTAAPREGAEANQQLAWRDLARSGPIAVADLDCLVVVEMAIQEFERLNLLAQRCASSRGRPKGAKW
jgi:hypothetical protein